jgi:hypothetical protein
MGILFAVFLLLLGSFDLIVYAAAENALYEEIDGQIADAEAHIKANVDGALDNFLKGRNIIYYNNSKKSYVISYRIFLLLRNQAGVILTPIISFPLTTC